MRYYYYMHKRKVREKLYNSGARSNTLMLFPSETNIFNVSCAHCHDKLLHPGL